MVLGIVWGIIAFALSAVHLTGGTILSGYELVGFLAVFGIVYIISGACGILCSIFIYQQKDWRPAFILCLIGSAAILCLGLSALPGSILEAIFGGIGIIMAYIIIGERRRFCK
jgi:hypothetical protein